ncbi:hypothetical protein [Arthrobacter sp. MYb213]|uniref:hypothetical protein n=1 Tax=Arthrobacter sp. MYb213 TaxID=1848595 RepID=UPI000CFC219C|nr:hypothetical protein [Arthrobacter sp. MYb213]PRB72792.1 hypothetical protein CQ011_03985 [Arthrobacter sp. MYb213]
MKNKLPLLVSLGALALLATSCGAATSVATNPSSSTPAASTATSSPSTSAPVSKSSSPATSTTADDRITADQIIPTLSRPDTDEDMPPAEIDDPSIKQVSFRALASLAYAEQFAAVNDAGDLCLVAWANSGDGDGTANLSGPGIECDDPAEVKDDGLSLRIKSSKDNPGVVLNMLPPDLTEDVVRTELLKIPGNHEDLRPPVEFGATDFGLVSVAMLPETADELGKISIPRPDGTSFALDLD